MNLFNLTTKLKNMVLKRHKIKAINNLNLEKNIQELSIDI